MNSMSATLAAGSIARQPAGRPDFGEFASHLHDDDSIALRSLSGDVRDGYTAADLADRAAPPLDAADDLLAETRWGRFIERHGEGSHWTILEPTAGRHGAAIVIMSRDRRLLMLNVIRRGVNALVWEIPMGMTDPGETGVETAVRETREETGVTVSPADVIALGTIQQEPSRQDSEAELYFAEVDRVALDLSHESTDGAWIPASVVKEAVVGGQINGSVTAMALLRAIARGLI